MATPVELRFVWPAGSATFRLTEQEALKAIVALRTLGLGLTFVKGSAITTTRTAKFSAAETVLAKFRRA
jgi:hypothetical protein